ncbi:TPA: hypothetical protein QDZ58_000420 [Pluralibacter gergoviae]|nr:hypothetical protein [Pluralibacter gergoviae]
MGFSCSRLLPLAPGKESIRCAVVLFARVSFLVRVFGSDH